MADKKEDEKSIISKFQKSNQFSFQVLDTDKAKSIFKNYTGENPDFVIMKNREYIGLELFCLSLDKTNSLDGKIDENENQIKNLHHRQSKFPTIVNNENDLKKHLDSLNKYGLARQDGIEKILIERISDKIKKLPLYITPKIWLLGYANEFFQTGMIENIYKDGLKNTLRQLILTKLSIPSQIEKIFLFETGTGPKNYFFEIK